MQRCRPCKGRLAGVLLQVGVQRRGPCRRAHHNFEGDRDMLARLHLQLHLHRVLALQAHAAVAIRVDRRLALPAACSGTTRHTLGHRPCHTVLVSSAAASPCMLPARALRMRRGQGMHKLTALIAGSRTPPSL